MSRVLAGRTMSTAPAGMGAICFGEIVLTLGRDDRILKHQATADTSIYA